MPSVGDSFRGDGEGSHLYVIITSPSAVDGRFVIVNLTTKRDRRGEDHTCVLQVGDHPYIRRDSIVLYAEAYITDELTFRAVASSGKVLLEDSFTPEVLKRIQQGGIASRFTPNKIKAALRAELEIP